MADPSQPTALEDTALAVAAPQSDPLDIAVARARTAAALFGDTEVVKVGRYRVIERAGAGGMGVVWSAWDPELGRGVALKLASDGDAAARARARDEGRALARLSHPNVVPIYDVIEHGDSVFLVMELVRGKTLRELEVEPQSVGQLVRAYRQAGEGLAAAHHAGLIHRDFKPANAILGADGRVRVLDFGLAHEAAPAGAASTAAIAGTPRYMAPEQRVGEPLTAAVDQYALCTALREAVVARGALPRWLAPILARGAAERPAERYPSMDALLDALALDPAARWRRRIAVGLAVLALGAIGAAFALGRSHQAESPCEGGPALVAPSWGPERRAAIKLHLAGLTTAYAVETAPRLVTALDGYAAGWVRLHRASCQAHRRGEISAALLDRRAGCLARRRAALAAVSELAGAAAVDALPGLVVAVGELPDLAACDDNDALMAAVPPPPPAQAAAAAAIAEALARVDVERDAGRVDEALQGADAALAQARALGYRPLLARALLARGRVTLTGRGGDRGAADFAEATREALIAGDEPAAIEAWARRAWAVGTTRDPLRATDGLDLIEAVTARIGDRAAFARALLHHNVGGVALARGDRDEARQLYERARREATAVTGSGAIELTTILEALLVLVDGAAARGSVGAELVAVRTRLLGAEHPMTLTARMLAAEMLDDAGAVRAELTPVCRQIAHYHPSLGALIGECGYEVAWLAALAGDLPATVAMADLALAAAPSGADPGQLALAGAYRQLGAGDAAAAATAFAAVRRDLAAAPGAPWYQQLPAAEASLGAAMALLTTGDVAGAGRELDGATARYDAIAAAMPAPALGRRRAALTLLRSRARRGGQEERAP